MEKNALTRTNGNGTALDPAIINSLVLNGDVGRLTADQKLAYVAYRCKQVGLDPAAQPFQLLKLQGKEVLYATAGATQQLCQTRGLSVSITKREKVEDIYCVEARVTDKDGRFTENMGSTPIGGLKGEVLSNALLKATTKAIRRTVLAHCGLGLMDETEAETIPGAQFERKGNPWKREADRFADEMEACTDREQLDSFFQTDEVKDFLARAGAAKGDMDYADVTRQRYYSMRDQLPEKKVNKKNFIKSTEEYGVHVTEVQAAILESKYGPEGYREPNDGNNPVTEPGADLSRPAPAPQPSPTDAILPEYSADMDALFRMIDLAENLDDLTRASLAIAEWTKRNALTAEDRAALTKAYKLRGKTLSRAAA